MVWLQYPKINLNLYSRNLCVYRRTDDNHDDRPIKYYDRNTIHTRMKIEKIYQLINDNLFVGIIFSEDEMVWHILTNLLHSLFEECSKTTNELKIT